jgi:hypothetical protein
MIYADRFLTNLRNKVFAEIHARHVELGNGSVVVGDNPSATGMKFVRVVGVITGLQAALTLIDEMEDEMSAKPRKERETR